MQVTLQFYLRLGGRGWEEEVENREGTRGDIKDKCSLGFCMGQNCQSVFHAGLEGYSAVGDRFL